MRWKWATAPGRFGAPGMRIDAHLACFTPKQSETYARFLRIAWGRSSELNQGNVDHFHAAPPMPVRLLVNRSGARDHLGTPTDLTYAHRRIVRRARDH